MSMIEMNAATNDLNSINFPAKDSTTLDIHSNYADAVLAWDKLCVNKTRTTNLKVGSFSIYTSVEKRILDKVSGVVKFGHLNAILGPSGAGKSTLLKTLFGTSTSHKISGKQWIKKGKRKCVFIAQNEFDHLLDNLTVEESIYYASKIKGSTIKSNKSIISPTQLLHSRVNTSPCPESQETSSAGSSNSAFMSENSSLTIPDSISVTSSMSTVSLRTLERKVSEVVSRVNKFDHEIIAKMGLTKCRHNLVSKCSGGERKRLAIAQELSCSESLPAIIFIDEPTSGLDSDASIKVMKQLLDFVVESASSKLPMAIVLTIHQPSYKLLQFFHKIYVLSVNGSCIYSGAPGDQLVSFLTERGFDCSGGNNPADVIIEAASIHTRDMTINHGYNLFNDIFGRTKRTLTSLSRSYLIPRRNRNEERDHHTLVISTITQNDLIDVQDKIEADTSEEMELKNRVKEMESETFTVNESLVLSTNFKNMKRVEFLYSSSVSWSPVQVYYLFHRSFVTSLIRKPSEILMRVIPTIVMAVLLGLMYGHDIGHDDGCISLLPFGFRLVTPQTILDSIRNTSKLEKNTSAIFFSLLFLSFMSMLPTVLTFPAEVKHFLAEKYNSWYPVSSYYWIKTFIEFISLYFVIYVFNFYVFWTTGNYGLYDIDPPEAGSNSTLMESSGPISRFHNYVFASSLISFSSQGIALASGALFPSSFSNSILFSVSIMLFNVLFSGFFIQPEPGTIMDIASKASFTKYGLETALISLYGKDRCKNFKPGSHFPVISVILYKFQLRDDHYNGNIIVLFSSLFVIRLIVYMMLCVKARIDFGRHPLSLLWSKSPVRVLVENFRSIMFTLISIIILCSLIFMLLIH